MDHLCSSSHPFSPSRRVDYCLNWPQPLPSPSFHFSSADIYWSLSEKFPSSHPFPKVELQRKSLRLVCACMCAWFINEPEQAFIFLFRFFFFFLSLWQFCSLLLVLWLSTCLSFLSISLKFCFISLHISSLSWPLHHPHLLSLFLSQTSALFTTFLFHPREVVQPFEPVLQFGLQELPHDSTWRQSLQFHLRERLFPCDRRCLRLHQGFWDVPCNIRLALTRGELQANLPPLLCLSV